MSPAVDIGRVCVKIAGRDAGRACVIVDILNDNFVVVAGKDVRRRKVNIDHLHLLDKTVKIEKNAPDDQVIAALESLSG